MIDKIKEIKIEIENFSPKDQEEIEIFRIKYLSKKGIISELFDEFKTVSSEMSIVHMS